MCSSIRGPAGRSFLGYMTDDKDGNKELSWPAALSSAVTSRTLETEPCTPEISGRHNGSNRPDDKSLAGYVRLLHERLVYWSQHRDKTHCRYHPSALMEFNLVEQTFPLT